MGKQKAVAKDTDVSEEVQRQAVECTVLAMEKYSLEREIVALIKRANVCSCWPAVECSVGSRSLEFEKKHSPTWHCVVGRRFGSSVSHETQHLIFSLVRGLSVLLFKAG